MPISKNLDFGVIEERPPVGYFKQFAKDRLLGRSVKLKEMNGNGRLNDLRARVYDSYI